MSDDRPPAPSEGTPLPPAAAVPAAAPPPRSWVRRIALFPLTRLLVGGVTCTVAAGAVLALATPLAGCLGTPREVATALMALPATATLLLAYALVFRLLEQRPISELSRRGSLAEGGGGFLLGLTLVTAVYGVLAAAGAYRVLGTTDGGGLWTALSIIVFFAAFEEVVFRGVLYRVIEGSLGSVLALAVSAAFFGWVHADNPGAGRLGAVSAGLAGVLLGLCYTLTRRLWLPTGLHIGWNYAQVVFGTPVSGTTRLAESGWLRGELVGSELLTGGAYGIENSPVSIALIVVLAVAGTVLAARRRALVAPFWRRRAQPTGKPPAGPPQDGVDADGGRRAQGWTTRSRPWDP